MLSQQPTLLAKARRAMAFDRKTFKNRLQDILGGAITHFYMVRLAELNRQSKWVSHWRGEIDRLVNMDTVRILVSEIKGNWDKRKALEESLRDVQAADAGYRRVAANYIGKVYNLKKLNRQLPAEVEVKFYSMVREAAERALRPEDTE
jgi:hypothetical protein